MTDAPSPAARRQRKSRARRDAGLVSVEMFIPAELAYELAPALQARGYLAGHDDDDLALAIAIGDALRDWLGLD